MPTVLRQDGFAIMIYVRDHEPMHVHVYKSGGMTIILLEDCSVRKAVGMKESDVAHARRVVFANRDFLHHEWERIRPSAEEN